MRRRRAAPTVAPAPRREPGVPGGQATVRTFDPATGVGTAVRDDGMLVQLPAAAFAAGGLRLLRPGQRVRLQVDGDAVVLVTIATLLPRS